MKNFGLNSFTIAVFSTLFLSCYSYSQNEKVTVTQDSKFENLLSEKRRINSSITINDLYKIQIFNGDSENSKKTLNDFKREFIYHQVIKKLWFMNMVKAIRRFC